MGTDAGKDFFISYTSADKKWAEWIAWQLEEAQYSTILQAWDFQPGMNFMLEMDKAARGARCTIVVLSPDYLSTRYTQLEWAVAFRHDPKSEKGALLPVRVQKCEVEELLGPIVYIDLVDLDEARAQETLLVGVRRKRGKPKIRPGFPGAGQRTILEPQRFPGTLPSLWNIPYPRNPYFTGREDSLKIKALFLAANPRSTNRLVIDEEMHTIEQKLRAAEYRDALVFQSAWAVRPDDLLQLLNQHQPHVVHFSGHGSDEGLSLAGDNGRDRLVTTRALKALFTTLKDNIRLVVLNACYSREQAQALVEIIDCVIGMRESIHDDAATAFASSFYRAIGFGRSIQEAFEQGIASILLEGIPEEDTPELLVKAGVDPTRLVLLDPPGLVTSLPFPQRVQLSVPSSLPHTSEYQTCFLSYASEDQAFAEQLYTDLQSDGVQCWFAPEDLKIGDKLRERSDRSISQHDKLLLILSEHSVESDWVEQQVEAAFEKEQRQKQLVLFPIQLDDAVMQTTYAWAATIRRRHHIEDFRAWKDPKAYESALERLLRDLRVVPSTVVSNQKPVSEMSTSQSVFKVNVPPTRADDFYGRVFKSRMLINNIRNGTSTSIVGPRRIGKTWFISYLRLAALDQLGSCFRIGYIDATAPSCTTVPGFIIEALKAMDVSLTPLGGNPDLASFEWYVKDMQSRNLIPVLCIDEFEGLTRSREFDVTFFTQLRAINQLGLVMVTASLNPLIDLVSEVTKTSPFFNVFMQLNLEPFDREEAEKFAQDKSDLAQFTEQEYGYLLRYGRSGGDHWPPLRLQLVGKMMLEAKFWEKHYRADDPEYWETFKEKIEETYRGMVK